MPALDVLLVTPASRAQVYQGLGQELAAIEPPVWSGLIAGYLLRRGVSAEILDAEALGLSAAATAREIQALCPRLTVFVIYGQQPSASTQCMPGGRAVAEILKQESPGLKTLVMGTHASALPKRTLEEEPYDFVCQGEGPRTVHSLAEALKEGARDFSGVPGLWHRQNGLATGNPPAALLADLDRDLPSQEWGLLNVSRYRAHNWHCLDNLSARQPYLSLQTSLGCPFRCNFCCINAPFGGPGIRYWSPANVVARIDEAVNKYGVRNIKIPDEMFVLNEAHVTGICDLLIERGYGLNIWAYARVDTVKDRFLEKLRLAGFRWLALGIESASKHVRDGAAKGRFGEAEIESTVAKIQGAGINVLGNYIFGLPDDTQTSMRETLALAQRLNTEWSNFYSAMAYPGSGLFRAAMEKNWPLPPSWAAYSQHAFDSAPLPTETLSAAEVLAFRDFAHHEYFSSPAYEALLRKKFGEPAVAHVRGMLGYRLPRRHHEKARTAEALP